MRPPLAEITTEGRVTKHTVARCSAEYCQGVKSVVFVEVFAVLVEQFVSGRVFRIVFMLEI